VGNAAQAFDTAMAGSFQLASAVGDGRYSSHHGGRTNTVTKSFSALLVFAATVSTFLPACGSNDPCESRICVRVSNQHYELDAPAEVQFDKPGGMSVAQLTVPVARLGFGESTDWYDPSDGATRQCTSFEVLFEARSDPAQPWSSPRSFQFSNQPSCYEQGNRYELVVR
jgi:hypothetical protein